VLEVAIAGGVARTAVIEVAEVGLSLVYIVEGVAEIATLAVMEVAGVTFEYIAGGNGGIAKPAGMEIAGVVLMYIAGGVVTLAVMEVA